MLDHVTAQNPLHTYLIRTVTYSFPHWLWSLSFHSENSPSTQLNHLLQSLDMLASLTDLFGLSLCHRPIYPSLPTVKGLSLTTD